MKTIIYKRKNGCSAEVYKHTDTKKEAKQILVDKWQSILQEDDNLMEDDGLRLKGTVLDYDVYKWFIEQDMSL